MAGGRCGQAPRPSLSGGAAAIDAEGHGTVFVAGYSFDQQVLHTSVLQIINKSVVETMKSIFPVGDAQFGLVSTELLRRYVDKLSSQDLHIPVDELHKPSRFLPSPMRSSLPAWQQTSCLRKAR